MLITTAVRMRLFMDFNSDLRSGLYKSGYGSLAEPQNPFNLGNKSKIKNQCLKLKFTPGEGVP